LQECPEVFHGFFRDNIEWCEKEGEKEGVLGDTFRLARRKVPKFPVFSWKTCTGE